MLDNLGQKLFTSLEDTFNSFVEWMGQHLPNILLILIVAWVVRRYIPPVISRLLHRTIPTNLYPTKADRDKRLKTIDSLVNALVKLTVFVVAAMLIIAEINPGYTAALFASAGIATVALGFGAQSLVKDFVSGMFIITENQYRVGDNVTIAGVTGTVEDVTVRTTVLRDLEGNIHFVPNGFIEVATNRTMGYGQINEEFVVPAETDMEELRTIVSTVGKELSEMPDFQKKITEAPRLGNFKGYAPNGGIIISIVGKTTAGDKVRIRSELYRLLNHELAKKGIHASNVPVAATAKK